MRAQSLSLVAGCVLAVIAVGVCAVLALITPRDVLGAEPIVVARESGAVYVRVGDTLHPVPNLASARLIARNSASPRLVSAAAIAAARRGPRLGIAGAPATIAPAVTDERLGWTLCDGATTTLIVNARPPDVGSGGARVLVTPRGESAATTYLLYEGRRAAVDLRDRSVLRALRLDGVTPLPVSKALINAIPEAPSITSPVIDATGTPGPPTLPGIAVGTVVQLSSSASQAEYFVVLDGGVQRVGQVVADLIRFTDSRGGRETPTVAPDRIAATAVVDSLPVQSYPTDRTEVSGRESADLTCARWSWNPGSAVAEVALYRTASLPQPAPEQVVDLGQADGVGPQIDAVSLPSGRSLYVRATGIAGDGGAPGPLYYIDDTGCVFGVHDTDTAGDLGLTGEPGVGPWPVLARLPRGPELSTESASVVASSR